MKKKLDEIIAFKRKEVQENRVAVPIPVLEKSVLFQRKCASLKKNLSDKKQAGIIAEFKRKSPSKGIINAHADVTKTTTGYRLAGASGLSVLTDGPYFGGHNNDLIVARNANEFIPVLRKDFTVDEYQVIEAKSIGADVILLIGAVLSRDEIKRLTNAAVSLGMEVLFEIHDEKELEKADPSVHIIGINNRNLQTFEVDIEHSIRLADKVPPGALKVAESGIDEVATIRRLKQYGFDGFLIGELFMRQKEPGQACKKFIEQLHGL